MNKVNETIDSICIWIQKQLENDTSINRHEVSDMVRALAELVSAGENLDYKNIKVYNKELLKKAIEESISHQERLTPNSIERQLRSSIGEKPPTTVAVGGEETKIKGITVDITN